MSSTVMVTGGTGFIGGHVARRLAERGDRVICFDQQPPTAETSWWLEPVAGQVTFVKGDITQWPDVVDAVRRHQPEVIVHTAAIGDPAAVQYRPWQALKVNVEGAMNCLEAVRIFGLRRIILFSSIGALPGLRYQPVDGNHPLICSDEGPGSGFYGASKVAMEAFAYSFRQSFGTDFVVLRPSAVYGFGMRHPIFIKPMVENSLVGRPTRFEHGREFPRDYTHVADVAGLVLRAIDAPADRVRDRIFYAATGRPLRTAGEVAQIVRSLVPEADIEIGPGLSETDQLEIRYRGVLSIDNAREQLGYEPRFGDLEDGVANYISDYRAYLESRPEGRT